MPAGRRRPPWRRRLAATAAGLSRRGFLKVGFGFSAALACASLLPALSGCAPSSTTAAPGLAFLREADTALFRALLGAVVSELSALDAKTREAHLQLALSNIDRTCAAMGSHAQGELRKLLGLLDNRALRWALTGVGSDWADADNARVQDFARWRASRFATLNAGAVVLVKLSSVAYFVTPAARAVAAIPVPTPQSTAPSTPDPAMPIDDLYTAGIASGWQVHDASTFTAPRHFEADVAIIGSGAGGGVTAETLSAAGLRVVLLEEGALRTSDSFRDMDEGRAYRELYRGSRARHLRWRHRHPAGPLGRRQHHGQLVVELPHAAADAGALGRAACGQRPLRAGHGARFARMEERPAWHPGPWRPTPTMTCCAAAASSSAGNGT